MKYQIAHKRSTVKNCAYKSFLARLQRVSKSCILSITRVFLHSFRGARCVFLPSIPSLQILRKYSIDYHIWRSSKITRGKSWRCLSAEFRVLLVVGGDGRGGRGRHGSVSRRKGRDRSLRFNFNFFDGLVKKLIFFHFEYIR